MVPPQAQVITLDPATISLTSPQWISDEYFRRVDATWTLRLWGGPGILRLAILAIQTYRYNSTSVAFILLFPISTSSTFQSCHPFCPFQFIIPFEILLHQPLLFLYLFFIQLIFFPWFFFWLDDGLLSQRGRCFLGVGHMDQWIRLDTYT